MNLNREIKKAVKDRIDGIVLSIGYWTEIHSLLRSRYDIYIGIDEQSVWRVFGPNGTEFSFDTFGQAISQVFDIIETESLTNTEDAQS